MTLTRLKKSTTWTAIQSLYSSSSGRETACFKSRPELRVAWRMEKMDDYENYMYMYHVHAEQIGRRLFQASWHSLVKCVIVAIHVRQPGIHGTDESPPARNSCPPFSCTHIHTCTCHPQQTTLSHLHVGHCKPTCTHVHVLCMVLSVQWSMSCTWSMCISLIPSLSPSSAHIYVWCLTH